MSQSYVSNQKLDFVNSNWTGNPVDKRGRYVNEEYPFTPEWKKVWKWKTSKPEKSEQKAADQRRVGISDPKAFFRSGEDGLVWLGHACFFIRIGGVSILIDPVFYDLPFIKQFIKMENPLKDLAKVDYLLISHDHRDHCDKQSICEVVKLFPNVEVLTGLGLGELISSMVSVSVSIIEAGWYQRLLSAGALTIDYLPTRHWGRRGVFDTNKRLWGAFMIRSGSKSIYFGGDSGYGSHYRKLRDIYGDISLALLGIGAYSPRWFMHASHMAPEEAVIALSDCGANKLLPMHYGKYDLSDEPPGEPKELIRQEMNKLGRSSDLILPTVGELVRF